MSNSKISALTSATTPLAGTETLPVVQSSATTKVTVANLTAGRAVSALSVTTTSDSTINSLTVGRGAGAVATNTVFGTSALALNATNSNITAVGYNAANANTANTTTAFGSQALALNTTGANNTAIGYRTLVSNVSGASNTAVGREALVASTGTGNTAVGVTSLTATTGANNTAIGGSSGQGITTGSNNSILGSYTGTGVPISATGSNYVVLSDGAGNVRGYFDSSNNFFAAGPILSNSVAVPTISSTSTLTNKWVQPRVLASTANSATPTLNTDNYDMMVITGQTVAITSFSTNLTGTPVNGQKLIIAITGTGAIGITWGASFEASTVALPTTTVTTNRLDVGFIWNVATTKWRCVAVA